MKVSIASDLHLEFGDINIYNIDDSDILILAGDIHENYTKTVNGKTFIYPGSNVQRNFGEGTYVKIRKNSTIFKAAEKVSGKESLAACKRSNGSLLSLTPSNRPNA